MTSAILYIIAGILTGAIAVSLLFLRRQMALERENAALNAQLKSDEDFALRFQATAQEALKSNNELFLQLAQEKFKAAQIDGAHDLDKRQKAIDQMVGPVHEKLEGLVKALEHIKGTDEALRTDLLNLNKETAKLAGALRNPAARGNWGEEMLERLLENSGLIKDVHYALQKTFQGESGRVLRPDVVIQLPDSLHVVIDAKAPVNDFIQHLDKDLDESHYKNLQVGLAAAVKAHIQELGKKAYWEQLNSPDFVVLFLPSEHLFSAAVQADPGLLELAAERKVILASPILTMSLLRVVGMSWRQVELAKNATEISERGKELYTRLLTFTDHIEKVGKNLQNAMKGYDAAVGSLEKSVLPAARKFKDLQGAGSGAKDLPALSAIEETPRALMLTSEDEQEKKRA